MAPLVSIVMPVYNGEQYLEEAIRSVQAQSYLDWELIVVDDGSTDRTANIVSALDDPRICYVYQPNRGQAAALNHGLRHATGDYVTTLDADDIYPPESLESRVRWLEAHPDFGAVYGDGYYCDPAGKPVLRFADYRKFTPVGDIYAHLISAPLFGTGASVMQRRAIMERDRLRYDESIVWCQDWDFYIRLAESCLIGYVDAITIHYRLHSLNMTTTMPEGRRLESLIHTKRKVLASARLGTLSEEYRDEFFYTLLVKILHGRLEDQLEIIQRPQFGALSRSARSRLLRLMATRYLLDGQNLETAARWLRRAWWFAPWDPKTAIVTLASTFHKPLAAAVVRAWRRTQDTGKAAPSPFQTASALMKES